jgi:hypothetical protein
MRNYYYPSAGNLFGIDLVLSFRDGQFEGRASLRETLRWHDIPGGVAPGPFNERTLRTAGIISLQTDCSSRPYPDYSRSLRRYVKR